MKELSQDPSSTIRRDGVISESRNLSSRFQELARQLSDADLDTQSELNYQIDQFNSLTDQLVTVNQRLLRSTSLSRQQPDLLNTRDKLLADMSELLRISVTEATNGVVDVNIGQGSNSVSVLTGASKLDIAVRSLRVVLRLKLTCSLILWKKAEPCWACGWRNWGTSPVQTKHVRYLLV